MAAATDPQTLSFEQAIAELEKIVQKLEGGSGKLEDAITDYERGTALQQRCEALLSQAELRVQKLIVGKSGVTGAEALDPQ